MWSEKRGIEDFIFLGVFPIVINISTNLVYFISGCSYSMLEVVNEFNSFTIFSIFICCLFNFFTPQKNLSKEDKEKLNREMSNMKLINIFFIIYIIFSIFIVRNISIIISAIIMESAYINCYKFKMKSKANMVLSETQKSWREFHNTYSEEDSNFLWRVKPMLYPHMHVKFSERIEAINWFAIIFFILPISNPSLESAPIIIIVTLLIFSDIIYIIDVSFGLYTKTEGVCTGVIQKENSKGSRRVYYEVYITDFKNKRELKFREYDYCSIREMDEVSVIHGSLSKKVIEVK